MIKAGTGEIVQQLRALAAIAENQNSNPEVISCNLQ